jgi:hypothetical protein
MDSVGAAISGLGVLWFVRQHARKPKPAREVFAARIPASGSSAVFSLASIDRNETHFIGGLDAFSCTDDQTRPQMPFSELMQQTNAQLYW